MQSHDLVGCDIGGPVQMEFSSLVDIDNKDVEEHTPGVTVQNFSSQGQMWRVYCRTTGTNHQYMSKLEYITHVVCDMNPNIVDIKDQYTHDLRKSLEVAINLGINHPPQKYKIKSPLTTDLVVEFAGINGAPNRVVAIYVKYICKFSGYRTAEKLELELKSLKELGVQTFVVSEDSIDKVIMNSILWMLTVTTDQLDGEATFEYAEKLINQMHEYPHEKLTTVLLQLDNVMDLPEGFHLTEVKCLMHLGLLSFDLSKNVLVLNCEDVVLAEGINHV